MFETLQGILSLIFIKVQERLIFFQKEILSDDRSEFRHVLHKIVSTEHSVWVLKKIICRSANL